MKRRWMGRSIIAIAVIHTLFGLISFPGVIAGLFAEGFFNTVGADERRGVVVWFLIAGFFMATTGLAVDQLEANSLHSKLASTGWVLLATTIVGILLMPVSGFWLLLIPALFAIRSR